MDPPVDGVLQKLLKLTKNTGYKLIQRNGQRHYGGPPPNWVGPAPKGCEVFIAKLPRDCYENEIVPVFGLVGIIYELRLMMDFSGYNRGFGFLRYTNEEDASKAVETLNNYRIRPSNTIIVSKSIDNDRLFVGGLPFDATKGEILNEFRRIVPGIVDVIMFQNPKDPSQNRGYVFLKFESHSSAALARRALIPGPLTSFGDKLTVDWAEPEPIVEENIMKQVKVLFVRHLTARTTEDDILRTFSRLLDPSTIEKVKKMDDYAFVHFTTRQDAENALKLMKYSILDGSKLELKWARPADKMCTKDQPKESRNSRFSKGFIFNNHLPQEKQMNTSSNSQEQNNNLGAICQMPQNNDYYVKSSPDILDDLSKRMNWGTPKYMFQYGWLAGVFYWSGSVLLQAVRLSNYYNGTPLDVGPFECQHLCHSQMEVVKMCSEMALDYLKELDFNQKQ